MDVELEFETQDNNVRKIEDIIDIQKANGNIRHVAFKLPSEGSNISVNPGKSLESGLSKAKSDLNKKKEKLRQKYQRDSDVISWPSDSDITVLRMKLGTSGSDKMDSVALGDGLHQPRSSSMVNLATLILSQRPSKHDVEEYLLPLTSWEHAIGSTCSDTKKHIVSQNLSDFKSSGSTSSEKGDISEISTKSKLARFLRLYFCPCCTCLYNLEMMQDKESISLEIVDGK